MEKNIKPVESQENKKITNLSITRKFFMLLKGEPPVLNKKTSEVLVIVGNKSCVNDVLDITNSTVAEKLDLLEETVTLSETLHDLHLEKYVSGLGRVEAPQPEEYTIRDVKKTIAYFNQLLDSREAKGNILSYKLREITDVALALEAYERSINGMLNNKLYKILVDYGTPLVKAKLLDACGFPAEEVSGVRISKGEFTFTDDSTGKVYTVPVEKGSAFGVKGYVHKLLNAIGKWNLASSKANNTGDSYDGERNENLLNGCNMLKAFTLMDCYLDEHGKFAPASSMFEVKSKVRKYEKAQIKAEKAKVKALKQQKQKKLPSTTEGKSK